MKKQLLSWTLVLGVSSITLVSCKRDNDTKPEEPKVSSIIDERDQKVYKTIKIGNQTWFAENLRYKGPIAAGYINDPYGSVDSTLKYGQLYTFEAAKFACPKGWHLPLDTEWKLLEHSLGMSNVDTARSGYGVKRGTDNDLGVKLQFNGGVGLNFVVRSQEKIEEVWTASRFSDSEYYTRYFSNNDSSVYRWSNGIGASLCVRCLKD